MPRIVGAALLLAACQRADVPLPEVEILLDQPAYGAFVGDGPVTVAGRLSVPHGVVLVDGERVSVDVQGRFETTLPVEAAYRNLDVRASLGASEDRQYVPVFSGLDPMDTWPGGITLRLTGEGLEVIGDALGEQIDTTGWDAQLLAALPPVDQGWLRLTPTAVSHDPTVVALRPAPGGIDTGITMTNVAVEMDLEVDIAGTSFTAPVTIGYGQIEIGAMSVPSVDDEGSLWLSLRDSFIVMDDPEVTIDGVDVWIAELVIGALDGVLEPVGELLLDAFLESFATVPLGGPYAFQTDLMGTDVEIRLTDAQGDMLGVAAQLGVGIGEPVPQEALFLPAPAGSTRADRPAHAVVGVHEGLLDGMLSDQLVTMLEQDIRLGGAFGEVIGGAVRNLPGGHTVPAEAEGWCLQMTPGPAYVVRLQDGIEPIAALYLPDVRVDVKYMLSGGCAPWLETSLALEVPIRVTDGTKVGIDLRIPEGVVFSYGAPGEWPEDEIVAGLSGMVEGMVGLVAGDLELDLAELMGGLDTSGTEGDLLGSLGELDLEILDSEPVMDFDNRRIEGYFGVSLALWPEG